MERTRLGGIHAPYDRYLGFHMGLDYKKILEECQRNFGAPRREFSWRKKWKNTILKPDWGKEEDELYKLFDLYWEVMECGDVRWGHITQANTLLFEHGQEDLPGDVLYCGKPSPYTSLEVLEKINNGVADLKFSTPKNEKLRRIADHLRAETTRAFGMEVPVSTDLPFCLSTTVFFRDFLPETTLNFSFLPIIVAKDDSGVVLPLPHWYWPKELKEVWCGKPVQAIGADFSTVDFRRWTFNVIAWDSWLLVLVLTLPSLLSRFFDGMGSVIGFASLAVPLTALFIRFFVARRRIRENHCTSYARQGQYVALGIALCTLVILDVIVILLTVLPVGDNEPWQKLFLALGGMGLIYFTGMILAMYPGRGWHKQ